MRQWLPKQTHSGWVEAEAMRFQLPICSTVAGILACSQVVLKGMQHVQQIEAK